MAPLSLSLLIWREKRSWPVASLVFVHGVLLRPAMTAYSDCGFRTYDTDDDDDDDLGFIYLCIIQIE